MGRDFSMADWLVDCSESGVDVHLGPPDVIVLGSRGERARSLKRLVLGSTCAYVVKCAATALCVVPPLAEAVTPS